MYVNLEYRYYSQRKWWLFASSANAIIPSHRESLKHIWSFEPDSKSNQRSLDGFSRKSLRSRLIAALTSTTTCSHTSHLCRSNSRTSMSDLATLKKRRGVAKASITRLTHRLEELESDPEKSTALDLARGMARKLETLDSDFRTQHHALIDLVNDEDALIAEQGTLDNHDDFVAELSARIHLISACAPSSDQSTRKVALKRLSRLQKSLTSIQGAIPSDEGSATDVCLLQQYEEELAHHKKEFTDTQNALLSIDLNDDDELSVLQRNLEGKIFNLSLQIKKQLHTTAGAIEPSTSDSLGKGVKLPKLDVPTFDGDILHWRTFWEQFCVSIHDRSNLSDAEKLVYLQQSLKGGSAKNTIEGLSRSGEYYAEAIECLRSRYDRPRLIHQTHVRKILEAPSLKDGTGKEL